MIQAFGGTAAPGGMPPTRFRGGGPTGPPDPRPTKDIPDLPASTPAPPPLPPRKDVFEQQDLMSDIESKFDPRQYIPEEAHERKLMPELEDPDLQASRVGYRYRKRGPPGQFIPGQAHERIPTMPELEDPEMQASRVGYRGKLEKQEPFHQFTDDPSMPGLEPTMPYLEPAGGGTPMTIYSTPSAHSSRVTAASPGGSIVSIHPIGETIRPPEQDVFLPKLEAVPKLEDEPPLPPERGTDN